MTDQSVVREYLDAGMRLTLLEKNGKAPVLSGWVEKKVSDERVLRHQGNIGMKLGRGIACLDIDPKNGGFEAIARLQKHIGVKMAPLVNTPSGGYHCYLRYEGDRKFKKNLKEYQGIDFLTEGSQCVIVSSSTEVGSYSWADEDFGLFETEDAPEALLALYSKERVNGTKVKVEALPEKSRGVTPPVKEDLGDFEGLLDKDRGGKMSRGEVEDVVSRLDPGMTNDQWVLVGMALKDWHIEDGLEVFEEWSKDGETYKEGETEKRWRSFDVTAGEGGVTMGTLVHMARHETGLSVELDDARQHICKSLMALGFDIPPVNWPSIEEAEQRCFVVAHGQRYIVRENGSLVAAPRDVGVKILKQEFGQFIDSKAVTDFIEQEMEPSKPTEKDKFYKLVAKTVADEFWAAVARNKTIGSLQLQVNMFASQIEIHIDRDVGTITLPFTGLRGVGKIDEECVDDFKEHAPEFDKIIQFILYSRFTSNAKISYLWLHCDSDWGKGFLFNSNGVFGGLGLVQEISVKEIEAAMEGKPVGISRFAMIDQWVLTIDEFKHVRSEIKQLDTALTASPKNEMRFVAPLYAKIFMSAETVPSLTGNAGVEAQFARRFSYIRGKGSLPERPVFRSKSALLYVNAVREYVRQVLMVGAERLRALGRDGAAKEADDWLEAFHDEYGLINQHKALNDTVTEIAKEIADVLIKVCDYMLDNNHDDATFAVSDTVRGVPQKFEGLIHECIEIATRRSEKVCHISRLPKLCVAWIEGTYDKSEAVKVLFKRQEIADLVDGHLFPDRPSPTTKLHTETDPQGKTVRGTVYSQLANLGL
jgi:hypothetical protein